MPNRPVESCNNNSTSSKEQEQSLMESSSKIVLKKIPLAGQFEMNKLSENYEKLCPVLNQGVNFEDAKFVENQKEHAKHESGNFYLPLLPGPD